MKNENLPHSLVTLYAIIVALVIALTYYRFFVIKAYPVLTEEDKPYALPAWVVDTFN